MCYRPANTVTIVKCLECGAFNKPTNETCQKCGADLNESRKAADEAAAPSPGAPKEISSKRQGGHGPPTPPRRSPSTPRPSTVPPRPRALLQPQKRRVPRSRRRTNHAMSGGIQRVF